MLSVPDCAHLGELVNSLEAVVDGLCQEGGELLREGMEDKEEEKEEKEDEKEEKEDEKGVCT